jgi:hypothetical protein
MALIEGEINEIIASSIDKCLNNIGTAFRDIFYWSLENRAGVKRNEIAERPEEFVMYLEKMFSSGASIIKEEMKAQIAMDLEIPWTNSNLAALIRFAARDASGNYSEDEHIRR